MHTSALPQHPQQGNYNRKVYFMWKTAQLRGYSHIMSIDDDIIMAPSAIAAMVRAPPMAILDGDGGGGGAGRAGSASRKACALLTPTISSGIPTMVSHT